jgi:hypothetical protein
MPFTWVGTTADMMNTDILQSILFSHLMSCYGKEIHQQVERQELSAVIAKYNANVFHTQDATMKGVLKYF